MKLIVGLGNPGSKYAKTRHNAGFMALDRLADAFDVNIAKNMKEGIYGECIINSEKVIFLKPQKFMNLSGEVVRAYVDYFKINIADILIIYDDMDTEIGNYKLKYKGSSGGHNGLKDIEKHLGTAEYKRLKIGISKPNIDVVDYVLGNFSSDESNKIKVVLEKIPNIINDYLIMDFEKVMSKYN